MTVGWRLVALSTIWLAAGSTTSVPASEKAGEQVLFNRDIRPILAESCFACHGPDAGTREGDLRLDTEEGAYGALAEGGRVLTPGEPAKSGLFQRVTATDPEERMPPADAGKHLQPREIDLIRRWIEQGARWEGHWAFSAPHRPAVPTISEDRWSANAIDRFILARLARAELTPLPNADRITLMRRLSFDLIGMPPTPAEVSAFLADRGADAYERQIDRLLASAHYGERMALHWLDLVRYADSGGYHSDVEHHIAPYRDYVIDAFNDNLPFDRFTREQLAGDLLPDPTLTQRIASGYNRLNKTTEEGGAQPGEYLVKYAADRVRTTAGAWMGATLGCAECHDHKYDPYTMRDFYSLAAFFADVEEIGKYGGGRRDPELMVPDRNQAAELAHLDAERQRLTAAFVGEATDAERGAIEERLGRLQERRKEIESGFLRTMVTVSVKPREIRILPRGNWLDHSGPVVEPAVPAFLRKPPTDGGRLTRLDLADWLVAPDNPLTARVFVNRLWRQFFGTGLSKRLDDVGAQGEWPTHPQLLDWLAVEFTESGWDVKHLVKLLVMSRTYRQTSLPHERSHVADPTNRLFARQARWRLDAETIRDSALATSGLLMRKIGGRSVKPYQPDGYWSHLNFPKRKWSHDAGEDQYRRGLYTHWQRTFLHPSLLAFDATSREECTAERPVSNTPKAALTLLNDPTYVEAARVFAERAVREGGGTVGKRIGWTWRQALSRAPNPREVALVSELLAANLAHYRSDEQAAHAVVAVGLVPAARDLDMAEVAAWTAVTRAILNLNEAITRN